MTDRRAGAVPQMPGEKRLAWALRIAQILGTALVAVLTWTALDVLTQLRAEVATLRAVAAQTQLTAARTETKLDGTIRRVDRLERQLDARPVVAPAVSPVAVMAPGIER